MAEEEVQESGGKKKKKLLFIILGVVLLGLLGGGGWFAYNKFFKKPSPEEQAMQEGAQGEEAQQGETAMVTLPTFLVNLADPLGRRYLKMTLDVEVPNKKIAEEFDKAMPKVRDAINLLLSSKTYADLATMESKILLKNEIVERLNQILGGSKVTRVYFTEIVIQ